MSKLTEADIQNLAIAHRYIEQFLGKGDMSLAEELLDENVQIITGLRPTGPIVGIEEYKQVFFGFYNAFPDVKSLVIEDSFAAGDRVLVCFKSFQHHVKDYFGIPKSDRVITCHEAYAVRLPTVRLLKTSSAPQTWNLKC